jgi:hypothetical protein
VPPAIRSSQGLDTSASTISKKECAAARSTRLRRLHFSTAETAAVFSPEGVNPQESLKGEIQAAADHSEIIPGPVNDAETQVVSPTDVAREPKFDTSTELGEHFGLAAEMVRLRIDKEGVRRPLRVKLVPFAATENRAHTAPGVRR